MDGQRQPYVPAPPSQTITQAATRGHGIQLPPPPPPRVPHVASHGGVPPPPPPPRMHSGSHYGGQGAGWQQAWARQPQIGQNYFPPPPPPPPNQMHPQFAYNPGSLSLQATAPSDQPLTYATYIPDGESFGPGVGIPPLVPHDSYDHFSRTERSGYFYDPDTSRYIPQTYHDSINPPHQPPSYREFSDASIPNSLPTASLQSSHSQIPTREGSSRYNSHTTSAGTVTHEADEKWPLDRVLQWLVHNGFSNEWQETFKSLDLKGANFLDLGIGGANGQGNLGRMHQDVYPQLAKECVKNGAGWDQNREREEGVRMRKLIRSLSETRQFDSGRFYENLQPSASADGSVETSPHLRTDPFDPPSAEPSRQETSSRSELSRNILGNAFGERRRHSPSTSSDHGVPTALRSSGNKSRGGSPAAQFASMVTADSTSTTPEMGQNKRLSSDSIMGRGFRQNQGSSTQDQSMKQNEMSSKDHKGFFNTILKVIGHESPQQSTEDLASESPTSLTNGFRYGQSYPYPTRSTPNSSETTLAFGIHMPTSECHARKVIQNPPPKKFIFVTLDGWNYRLVDVTDVDAADMLRARLCNGVGIKDPSSALIYVTEPGRIEHEEPLSDTMLVVNRRSKSDDQGSLKFFIQSTPAFRLDGIKPQTTTPEEETRNRHVQNSRRVSPSITYRTPGQNLSSYSVSNAEQDRFLEASMDDKEREAAILAAHKEHRRIAEQKQQAFLQSKQEQRQKQPISTVTTHGIKRGGIIDFDSPRISPYEDKRSENFFPLRKPPIAPAGSSTLSKVNSLKKPGEKSAKETVFQGIPQTSLSKDFLPDVVERPPNFSPKSASPSMGIAAAFANMGKMSGSIAKPFASSSPFSHSPRTPSGSETGKPVSTHSTDPISAGSQHASPASPIIRRGSTNPAFNLPDYSGNVMLRQETLGGSTTVPEQTAFKSPEDGLTTSQSRLSHGPDFDFQETEVSFHRSPQPATQDSDEDSDEGLFAKPLANTKNKTPIKRKSPLSAVNTQSRLAKPALTVNTNSRAAKGLSVTFKSPGPNDTFTPVTDHSDPQSAHHSAGPDADEFSPQDVRNSRRQSFVRDDVWASRPPVEGMIDQLDLFFPGIDLDEPYLEGITLTPPLSPTTLINHPEPEVELSQSLRDRVGQGHSNLGSASRNASDTFSSDESTLKAKAPMKTVAQRNLSRSGGLGRMKSIREVAKGAHQIRRNQSIAAATNAQSGVLRRKSTKMFGARIMQISPKPGTRLSDLDPLPQHPVPQEKIPQRQPTFRIIRGQLIGKGTYGRVYLGMNAETGDILAVKQVEVNQKAAGYDKDRIKEMVAAMDQEIDTMQHLEHPNIVQYLGCHRSELSISIYLEYIPGGSIGSCLRKHGKFEESIVKSLTIQTLSGLSYLHNQGILHRDLKADNILLDLDGTCKISDFGISKKSNDIYCNDESNSMQGSVFWMAPEVVQSQGKGYSAKVDIWSLGCVVLEMFAGRRPWSKEEAIGAIFKLGSLNEAPPIPEDVSLTISPAAIAFMWDCFTMWVSPQILIYLYRLLIFFGSRPYDRPTAETLLSQHPFCTPDPKYNFLDTELHAKIGHL
ncbi:mitogen-activated protein kinase kinase kinase [Ophidiomyces ophidiicola]|nr:mitogen-activated protein kinase kinase kinase [Ophidiomyces ophidiicola]KAI2021878.1 mitogen-activated protein kinase kinase kinase [Ophidiomyces ophidiicola]KAI2044773.1 mitogen-activated protein kinase kinase kinase [Ophidiomyces ophidiicola]KAI2094220.1 mitogen-activated protein kinase kinase kinase [Ophidiomyces ophidiicola]KAI2183058.1 mitogen-activated protein kinase kinase kinase [Ophidiomyces ophidiicola]